MGRKEEGWREMKRKNKIGRYVGAQRKEGRKTWKKEKQDKILRRSERKERGRRMRIEVGHKGGAKKKGRREAR